MSSRRSPTAVKAAAAEEKYRVTPSEFRTVLKGMSSLFNVLVVLNTTLASAGKGAKLQYAGGQELDKKKLRTANTNFGRQLVSLGRYFTMSKKKPREKVRPDSFKGTYTPVYAGDALVEFFSRDPKRFGSVDVAGGTNTGGNIMDQLPLAKAGYLLRNTITMLFYIYAHNNNLQDPENAQIAKSDDYMTAAFGGNIAATFYSSRGSDGKISKIPMDQAVRDGLIDGPWNTYEVISDLYPAGTRNKKGQDVAFNKDRFNTYYYQNIAAANYYSKTAMVEAVKNNVPENIGTEAQYLADPANRQAMLREHTLVKAFSAEWHDVLEPDRKAKRDARKKVQDAQKRASRQSKRKGSASRVGSR